MPLENIILLTFNIKFAIVYLVLQHNILRYYLQLL